MTAIKNKTIVFDNIFKDLLLLPHALNKNTKGAVMISNIIFKVFTNHPYFPKNKLMYSNNAFLLSIATIHPAVAT